MCHPPSGSPLPSNPHLFPWRPLEIKVTPNQHTSVTWRICFVALLSTVCGFGQGPNYGWTSTNSLAMPQVGEHTLRILSPTLLELTLITTQPRQGAPVDRWDFIGENFAPKFPPAAAFRVRVADQSIPVAKVGYKRRPLYAPNKVRDLRILSQLYLELRAPIPEGETVSVESPDASIISNDEKFSASAEPLRFNPALHVNQLGYAPEFPKRAMVGYYLGSLGEMSVGTTNFFLINTAGEKIFEGKLRRRMDKGFTYTPPPYQNVFEADFSEFSKPGIYRLAVEGMGASYPFQIHEGTFAAIARTYALGLYHQRCGTNNALPYTRHTHEACHTAPAEVLTKAHKNAQSIIAEVTAPAKEDPRHTAKQLKSSDASLYPFVRTGKVDVSGGHHDAGDYSKYTINSAGLIHALVFAADNFEGAGELDNLGLPESGDGKSDLLQEAKWEADFLAKMQDNDGGFYFLVYPRDRRYEDNVLPDKGDPQIVWPKNTSATAAATAALAEIASSPTFKKQFPEAADLYLRKAQRGWAFLEKAIAQHGSDGAYQMLTHYGNEFFHDDELGWAAAALFAATGDKKFEKRFADAFNPEDTKTRRWSWWPMFEGWGNAVRTYVFATRNGRIQSGTANPEFLTRCEMLIHNTAANHIRFARETGYGTSFPDPNKANKNAGWYFSTERAFDLAVAHALRKDDAALDAIIGNVNYELGCNPVNVSYVTGLGWRRQREIVNQFAQNDHRTLPPTGLEIGNIQSGFAWLHHYGKDLGAFAFPPDGAETAPYPFYDRWGDSFNTSTESVVVDQARSLATAAFLMAKTSVKSQPWKSVPAIIVGLPKAISVGQPITASLKAEGVDLADAQIVWEARDQEPFMASQAQFAPKNVGEQWIEAEALLPDGRRLFAKGMFSAVASMNVPVNAFFSSPLDTNAETVALYHLDKSPADAANNAPALRLAGKAGFDTSNLSWMAHRAGAALRFKDIGDRATTKLTLPHSEQISEITLEAMIYLNAFKAYNKTNVKILSLAEEWNSTIEFIENMYEGPMIKGGTQFSINQTTLTNALKPGTWHHLAITINKDSYTARLNGKTLSAKKTGELANWGKQGAMLEFGNFDGYIDEVAVLCKTSAPAVGGAGAVVIEQGNAKNE
jgi:hypothetical protein